MCSSPLQSYFPLNPVLARLAQLPFRQRTWIRLRLFWGKMRRQYLIFFRPGYIKRSLERRLGHCARSGACCHLTYTCAFYKNLGDTGGCGVYSLRPRVCRYFPIDERDLAERDLLMPDHPCGFSFAKEAAQASPAPATDPQAAKPGYVDLTRYHSQGMDKEVNAHAE